MILGGLLDAARLRPTSTCNAWAAIPRTIKFWTLGAWPKTVKNTFWGGCSTTRKIVDKTPGAMFVEQIKHSEKGPQRVNQGHTNWSTVLR